MAAIEASQRAWSDGMAILDTHLADNEYVAGDAFTLADIPLGPIIHRWFNLEFEKPDMPHARRWCDTISERPAVQKWVLIEMQ